MKYAVYLRMKNLGPAKFLIDSWQFDDFMSAFHHAKDVAGKLEQDHFVEICESKSGEKLAGFNEGK